MGEEGEIKYEVDGEQSSIKFFIKDVDVRNVPKCGDKVGGSNPNLYICWLGLFDMRMNLVLFEHK